MVDTGKKQAASAKDQPPEGVIVYEFGKVTLKVVCEVVYQPPDYQDPNQPSEEEWKAAQAAVPKGKKKEETYVPIMLTPEPIQIPGESGRKVKIELVSRNDEGQEAPIKVNWNQALLDSKASYDEEKKRKEEEEEAEKEAALAVQENVGSKSKVKPQPPPKKNAKDAALAQEPSPWAIFTQEAAPDFIEGETESGKAVIKDLDFPENFPKQKFYFKVSDLDKQGFFKSLKPAYAEVFFDILAYQEDLKKKQTGKRK